MQPAEQKLWNERWRLAALEREELIRLGLTAMLCGMIFVLFHLQGNSADIAAFGRSIFLWLKFRWNEGSGDFSHGWLIPVVSIGVIWWKREELAAAPRRISYTGLFAVVCSLMLHYIGAKAQQPRLSTMGFIGLTWSIPFYLFGWQVAKFLIFPCAYLIFCIPLNFLDTITYPLKMFVSVATEFILNGLGIGVIRDGSQIFSVAGQHVALESGRQVWQPMFQFNIDDPCSGLRSLLALTAITAVYAYVTQRTLVRKWLLFLASFPIAVLGNMARILTIGLMAQGFGQKVATGLYHDYSGYIFFPVAIGLMLGAGALINMDYRDLWRRLRAAMKAHQHPESPPMESS